MRYSLPRVNSVKSAFAHYEIELYGGHKANRQFMPSIMFDALREVENGVVVRVRVIPGASKTTLEWYDNWKKSIKFKTTEPAKRGKANRSVLEFFEDLTGKRATLLSGAKSRDKEILVLGATLKEVSDKLNKTR